MMSPRRQLVALQLSVAVATGGAWAAEDFIPAGAKFDPASELGEYGTGGDPSIAAGFEKGELGGVRFYIYRNGRARYAGWDIWCTADRITDVRSCTLSQGDFWVSVDKTGAMAVIVGDDHARGTPVFLRLDKAPALTSATFGWSGKAAAKIVADATRATIITTRHTKRLAAGTTDGDVEARGLAGAIRIARWMASPT